MCSGHYAPDKSGPRNRTLEGLIHSSGRLCIEHDEMMIRGGEEPLIYAFQAARRAGGVPDARQNRSGNVSLKGGFTEAELLWQSVVAALPFPR